MPQTHFAAIKNGLVIDTRSSASRSAAGGTGKFGLYTHAVLRRQRVTLEDGTATEREDVISWHNGPANANAGLRKANVGQSWHQTWARNQTITYLAAEVLEVIVTAKKLKVGAADPRSRENFGQTCCDHGWIGAGCRECDPSLPAPIEDVDYSTTGTTRTLG